MNGHLSKPVRTGDLKCLLDETRPVDDPAVGGGPSSETPRSPEPSVDLEWFAEITGGDAEILLRFSTDYLEQADEIIGELRVALRAGDLIETSRLAHKLAGSSSTCGMRPMARLLSELEQVRDAARLQEAEELHAEVAKELVRIRASLGRIGDGKIEPAVR